MNARKTAKINSEIVRQDALSILESLGPMTSRELGDRIGLDHLRIASLLQRAHGKVYHKCGKWYPMHFTVPEMPLFNCMKDRTK